MKNKAQEIRILTIRDQKVVLDVDLARIYGVTTKRLNEQLRRNRKRFPQDFAFRLTADEFEFLRSQIATLDENTSKSAGSKRSQTATTSSSLSSAMWSQFATTSGKRRRKTHRPWAFTEHGALQAANILRSDRAIAMSVYVIRAFIELRERVAANAAILKRLAEIDKTLLEHDTALRDIYQQLLPLLSPPPEPPRRQIGFHPAL
jgi:ORF6N domain